MKKTIFLGIALVLILSGCGGKTVKFKKGDIKDDFCGAYINFQYCKCAFHNDFCDSIGLSRGAAKDYVYEEYSKWVDREQDKFQDNCVSSGGIPSGNKCKYCDEDEVAQNGRCVAMQDTEEGIGENDEAEDGDEGGCKYDSECDAICEGNVMWKMGCNPREGVCEKTFDTDCSADIETFGSLSFSKVCQDGVCVRDDEGIKAERQALEEEKKLWSDTVKAINDSRADINVAMLDANKNCINGIADMTNVAIMEFSTRIASVLAGGIPDVAAMTASAADKAAGLMAENMKNLAGAAVDYAGFTLEKLYAYQKGEPTEEEKKLKPHEYIKLNCDLYNYFKSVLAESDIDLESALEEARRVESELNSLPQ